MCCGELRVSEAGISHLSIAAGLTRVAEEDDEEGKRETGGRQRASAVREVAPWLPDHSQAPFSCVDKHH